MQSDIHLRQQQSTEPTHAKRGVTNDPTSADLMANAPGQLRVIKRNGKVAPYDHSKIGVAVTKAFLAVEGGQAAASTRIHETVAKITDQITQAFNRRLPTGGNIHIEDIQDQVELALMRAEEHKVARSYVLYREERRKARETQQSSQAGLAAALQVTLHDGAKVPLDIEKLRARIEEACQDLSNVEPEVILHEALRNLYDGIPVNDIPKAIIICTRPLIERDPNYSYVAARLLLATLRHEALGFLGLNADLTQAEMGTSYSHYFKAYLQRGIELELLDPKLKEFDLEKLGQALDSKT